MANEKRETCREILAFVKQTRENLIKQIDVSVLQEQVSTLGRILPVVISLLEDSDKAQYEEYIMSVKHFCDKFDQVEMNSDNLTMFDEALAPLISLITSYAERGIYKCTCCGSRLGYAPLPQYYIDMRKKYSIIPHVAETLNEDYYNCKKCGASDRDRLIVQFLREIEAPFFKNEKRLLQFAPASTIENWIKNNCTKINYESTDLFMDGVDFKTDVQDMNQVEDKTYDFWISSHVLEHVKDDRKAMREMHRILKDDGIGIFLVPISLDVDEIDEEWGLSEEENWKRFGQDDHCRMYGKKALVERLEECGFNVLEYNRYFIDEKAFFENAYDEKSTLYILTKEKIDLETLLNRYKYDSELAEDEHPLVSVCMSAYNHAPFVEDAILSVINQTYKNIEFIVGDDHSPDETADIMKRYSQYFNYEYYSDVNHLGLLEDYLIHETKGKYVCLINSDDMWENDKVEEQVKFLERNPDYVACFTWCDYVDRDLEPLDSEIFMVNNRTRAEWIRRFFLYGNCLCHPSIMIRREKYKELLNYAIKKYRQLPDFYMWVRLVQEEKIYVLQDSKIKMRRYTLPGRENTSTSSAENNNRTMNETMDIWYSQIKGMKNDVFVEAFKPYLTDKDVKDDVEIKCEKFLLLQKMDASVYRLGAMLLFYEWYDDETFKDCLNNKYDYYDKDFYKISSSIAILKCDNK